MFVPDIRDTFGFSTTNGIKVLCYGNAGVGKTYLCSTGPSPLILSTEAGLMTLRKYHLPYIEVKGEMHLKDIWGWLQTPDAAWVQTVCLDSISEIAEVLLTEVMKIEKDGRRYWGILRQRMWDVVKNFRDLPGKNVFMTCKEEMIKTDSGLKYACSMPGNKLGPDMPYFFDEVFRLCVGTTKEGGVYRYLLTHPTPDTIAKDRSGDLAPVEVNPNLSQLFAKIQGGHNG